MFIYQVTWEVNYSQLVSTLFFLGYDLVTKPYRLFNPWTRKNVLSKDVIFDEKILGIKNIKQPTPIDQHTTPDLDTGREIAPTALAELPSKSNGQVNE